MKKLLYASLGLIMACNSTQKTTGDKASSKMKNADPVVYAETITEAELKEHLFTYASDEFEGRETGKPGQKKAIEYLRNHYKDLNIPAAKKDGDYFQDVPLEISKMPTGSISANGQDFMIGEGFISMAAAAGNYNNIVYVGYGIDDENYSDYAGLDVKGKLVLAKTGEPMKADGTYNVSGNTEKSVWSSPNSLNKRSEVATAKGAKGLLYFDDANFKRYKQFFDRMKGQSGRIGPVNSGNDFSMFIINNVMAKKIYADIETSHKPTTLSTPVNVNLKSSNEPVKSENVAAYIKGSEKPNEYIVISSHLDHIGISRDGQVNNGADDDGSGTVALLEIAEAFKTAAKKGHGPKRSVVFLHVTGEEKGLLGSQHYTDVDPIFPLAQTVANLNIDMIGRIDPKREGDRNYVYLIGSDKLSTELHNLSEEVNNKYANIELDYTYNDENDPNRFYYRSDHYNFAKNNIPIIFYFNGTHDDYHRPSDTPDKINYDLLQNRARLVFHTAWEVANREQRIVADKAE